MRVVCETRVRKTISIENGPILILYCVADRVDTIGYTELGPRENESAWIKAVEAVRYLLALDPHHDFIARCSVIAPFPIRDLCAAIIEMDKELMAKGVE